MRRLPPAHRRQYQTRRRLPPPHQLPDPLPVRHIDLFHLHRWTNRFKIRILPRALIKITKIIHPNHAIPAREKRLRRMRPNKPRRPSHENRLLLLRGIVLLTHALQLIPPPPPFHLRATGGSPAGSLFSSSPLA